MMSNPSLYDQVSHERTGGEFRGPGHVFTPRHSEMIPSIGGAIIDDCSSGGNDQELGVPVERRQNSPDVVPVVEGAAFPGINKFGDDSAKTVPPAVKYSYVTYDEIKTIATDEGFAAFYNRYRPYVFNMAARGLANAMQAEDVTQEVFRRAYKSIDRFEGRATFSSWLGKITLRLVNTARTREHTSAQLGVLEDFEQSARNMALPGSEDALDAILDRHELQNSLRHLDPHLRQVLLLTVCYRETGERTAEIMGTTVAAVKAMKHRALKQLRDVHFQTPEGVKRIEKVTRAQRKAEVKAIRDAKAAEAINSVTETAMTTEQNVVSERPAQLAELIRGNPSGVKEVLMGYSLDADYLPKILYAVDLIASGMTFKAATREAGITDRAMRKHLNRAVASRADIQE